MPRAIKRANKVWVVGGILCTLLLLVFYFSIFPSHTLKAHDLISPFAARAQWQLAHDSNSQVDSLSREILSQPFYYLAEGGQMIAFASADGHYVLKCFKFQRFRPSQWVSLLQYLSLCKDYCQRHTQKRADKLEAAFSGCKLAYEKLQRQSGIIALQLNGPVGHSDSHPLQVTLFDKAGNQHSLPLDRLSYVLQERAEIFSETLAKLLDRGDVAAAGQRIAQLLALYDNEYAMGIYDRDHGIMHNIGCQNDRVIHLDVGRLVADDRIKEPDFQRSEKDKITSKLTQWLQRHYPQYESKVIGGLG